jgi:hypothetical protein
VIRLQNDAAMVQIVAPGRNRRVPQIFISRDLVIDRAG